MDSIQKTLRIVTFTVVSVGCGVGACWTSGGWPNWSLPGTWALAAVGLGSALANGLQIRAFFDKPPVTAGELMSEGRRTRFEVAGGLGDVHEHIDRSQAALDARLEKLEQALVAKGAASGDSGAADDPILRIGRAELVKAEDPPTRQAVDEAIAGQVENADAQLETLAREAEANAIGAARSAAARWRDLGATRSLWWVAGAVEAYEHAHRLEPDDFWTMVILRRLLAAANQTSRAFQIANLAIAASRPDTRNRSVACNELGDVLRARNDLAGALSHYEEGLIIARRLATSDESNEDWARDVSVSLIKIGDVLRVRNDLAGALSHYEEGLVIARRLAVSGESNGERARDLWVSLIKIGDVLRARNDLAGALSHYEEGLVIARRLAASDETNGEWARDVSVSLNKIGDVLRARNDLAGALSHYEEGLIIARRLATSDETNGEWARDVSVSLIKIGDVLRARNDLAGALSHYEEGLVIARRLAASDEGNSERARDVSVSLNKIGDVLQARNDLAGALSRYEEGLVIRRRLAASDDSNMGLRRDVWTVLWRLAPHATDPAKAWDEIVAGLEAMQAEGVLLPADERFIAIARANADAARAS